MTDIKLATAPVKITNDANSRILRQASTAGFLEQKIRAMRDRRSTIQRTDRSKCSRCFKPADENGGKRLELLEPLKHLEPNPDLLQSSMWAIIAILIATQEKTYEDRPDDVG